MKSESKPRPSLVYKKCSLSTAVNQSESSYNLCGEEVPLGIPPGEVLTTLCFWGLAFAAL